MSTEQIQDLDWTDADLTPEQVAAEINRVGGTIERIMTKWHAKLDEVRALIVRLKEQHAEEIADAENQLDQMRESRDNAVEKTSSVIRIARSQISTVVDNLRRYQGAAPEDMEHAIDTAIRDLQGI